LFTLPTPQTKAIKATDDDVRKYMDRHSRILSRTKLQEAVCKPFDAFLQVSKTPNVLSY